MQAEQIALDAALLQHLETPPSAPLQEHEWSAIATSLPPPAAEKARRASPSNGKWSRRLVVTKQPPSEFYKDEGQWKWNATERQWVLRRTIY